MNDYLEGCFYFKLLAEALKGREGDLEPGGSDALFGPSPLCNPGGGTAGMVTGNTIL